MKFFYFDGISCDTYGAAVHSMYPALAPVRSVESVEVPGRNGNLIYDNGRFANVTVSYAIYFKSNFAQNYKNLIAWLLESSAYKRLSDDWDSGYYRKARLVSYENITVSRTVDQGAATLMFDCPPQRWLTSGEETTSYTVSTVITNPTRYAAKPLIRAYGTGTFQIGNTMVKINRADEYTDIDCELMDCYKGTANCNGNVELERFPTLEPGNSSITMTGITQLDITPRWWTL